MEAKIPGYTLIPPDTELPGIGEQYEIAYFRLFQSSTRQSWYITGCEEVADSHDTTFEGIDGEGCPFVLTLADFRNMSDESQPILTTVCRDTYHFTAMPVTELNALRAYFY